LGQTVTEKILARAAGKARVVPGELINARVDFVMGHDLSAPLAINAFREMGGERVWDPERVALVNDHFVPAKDAASAALARTMREFSQAQKIRWYFEVGQGGICHTVLPEQGLALPGEVVLGADSHSCTYGGVGAFATGIGSTDLAAVWALGELWLKVPPTIKFVLHGRPRRWVEGKDYVLSVIGRIGGDGARYQAMEYGGEAIAHLGIEDRLTMCNMAIEAGGKNAIIPADEVTLQYVRPRAKRPFTPVASDPDAEYIRIEEFDVSDLEPQVALPSAPDKVHPVREYAGVKVDQVFIGSCTNSRITDLRRAAAIIKGRRVAPGVRLIVTPSSQQVYLDAVKEGLVQIFLEAGAAFTTSTCGACLGGHNGVLGEGEVCVSTTNRNFSGRMGHPSAQVYLVNPEVAAATAVAGVLALPDEVAAPAPR
jgi:3-isopropylmalate/(R)-2-methylmalate dehydratase large subunit